MKRIFKQESKFIIGTSMETTVDHYYYDGRKLYCVYKGGYKTVSDYSWKEFKDIDFRHRNIGYYEEVV